MGEKVVDAGAALDARDAEHGLAVPAPAVEGARGAVAFASGRRSWPVGARSLLIITGLVVAGIVTALMLKARSLREEAAGRPRHPGAERVEKRAPELKLAALAPVPEPGLNREPPAGPGVTKPGEAPEAAHVDVVQERRLARGFGAAEGEGGEVAPGAAAPASGAQAPPTAQRPGALEEKLEAPELHAASAGVLPDRNYVLTQGAMLDCVLETRIVSTVAGMTSCHLTRDVYSTNGRVVLLDRGSRVVGRYQGGEQHGDARIFVLWTRVETPTGVIVELQSPGTGPLGEAGVGGWVDTHFWDRFGAAILMSVIEDGTDAAAARMAGTNQGGGTNLTFAGTVNSGKDVVTKSMEPTVNIPPTLYKNQGERVGIFVARDLDFRSVYGLAPGARAER